MMASARKYMTESIHWPTVTTCNKEVELTSGPLGRLLKPYFSLQSLYTTKVSRPDAYNLQHHSIFDCIFYLAGVSIYNHRKTGTIPIQKACDTSTNQFSIYGI